MRRLDVVGVLLSDAPELKPTNSKWINTVHGSSVLLSSGFTLYTALQQCSVIKWINTVHGSSVLLSSGLTLYTAVVFCYQVD